MSKLLAPVLGQPSSGVIITGGASGIGLASARALAAVGRPVALWDINDEKVSEAAAMIGADFGVPAKGQCVDVRDPSRCEEAIADSKRAIGSVGGLVHSAGIVDTGSLEGITERVWADGIDTHLRPLALLVRSLLPDLAANSGSAIVAIASINATLGNAMNPVYSAAKAGMLGLVRSLADRLAMDAIRINAVSPGVVLTPMTKSAVDALPQGSFERRILLERLGHPDEIARAVRFLMSDEASYITATELVVDGGNISSQRM